MSDTVTRPTTPAEWAAALDVATSTQATLYEGDVHSATSDLISFAHVGGAAAGVSLASGEIHALHGLPDTALLSADGLWRVSWCAHDGYWDWAHYDRPAARVALDMAHDLRVAGLPDHPAIVRQQLTTWRTAAYPIADELLAQLTIVYPGYHGEVLVDFTHTFDGDPSLAGRIWQEAHDASGVDLSSSWLVADLEHDEDFSSWQLSVCRYHARGRPEFIETVAADSRQVHPRTFSVLVDTLRERGYGTIGPWVETDGQGDFGILVVHS
jgi:hypothetical protein